MKIWYTIKHNWGPWLSTRYQANPALTLLPSGKLSMKNTAREHQAQTGTTWNTHILTKALPYVVEEEATFDRMTFPVSLTLAASLVLVFCSSKAQKFKQTFLETGKKNPKNILGQQEIVRYCMALFFKTLHALIIQLTKYSEKQLNWKHSRGEHSYWHLRKWTRNNGFAFIPRRERMKFPGRLEGT